MAKTDRKTAIAHEASVVALCHAVDLGKDKALHCRDRDVARKCL